MDRCAGIKRDGGRCTVVVGPVQTHCYAHDPDRSEERRRNASRGGKSKGNGEVAELKAQLKKLAADVLSGEVERGAATAVNQIINSQARLLEAVMNSIRNGLGMRETEIVKQPTRSWNPHFYAIFA